MDEALLPTSPHRGAVENDVMDGCSSALTAISKSQSQGQSQSQSEKPMFPVEETNEEYKIVMEWHNVLLVLLSAGS